MNRFNLTFDEAIEKCFNGDGFIQGEHFAKGIYAKDSYGVIVLCKSRDLSFKEENLIITRGVLSQKYRMLTCAIEAENI